MKSFAVNPEGMSAFKQKKEQNKPYAPKASTCLSMQETLANALGSRVPQNNGTAIIQPGTSQGFGRSK